MNYFLVWMIGSAAAALFCAISMPVKEANKEIGGIFILCFLWPVTMPIVVPLQCVGWIKRLIS